METRRGSFTGWVACTPLGRPPECCGSCSGCLTEVVAHEGFHVAKEGNEASGRLVSDELLRGPSRAGGGRRGRASRGRWRPPSPGSSLSGARRGATGISRHLKAHLQTASVSGVQRRARGASCFSAVFSGATFAAEGGCEENEVAGDMVPSCQGGSSATGH